MRRMKVNDGSQGMAACVALGCFLHVSSLLCDLLRHVCPKVWVSLQKSMTSLIKCEGSCCSYREGNNPLASNAPLYTLVCVCLCANVLHTNLAGICSLLFPLQAVCCLLFLL